MPRPRSGAGYTLDQMTVNPPANTGSGAKDKDDAASLRGAISFTPEQLEGWNDQAEMWQEDQTELLSYLSKTLLVHIQVMDYVVQHPPKGRSGVAAVMAGHREFKSAADLLIEALLKRKESSDKASGTQKPR